MWLVLERPLNLEGEAEHIHPHTYRRLTDKSISVLGEVEGPRLD